MKKVFKSRLFVAIITGIICITGTAYAASQILASNITYKDTTVDKVLDKLYDKANAKQTVCMLLSGTANTVGAKYHCDLGDGELRNFYVLKVNTNDVELIMEKNITDTVGSNTTMNWDDATHFFDNGNPGYTTKQTWLTKVIDVDLPSAQDIADAGGISGWNYDTATADNWSYFGKNSQSDNSKISNYEWLYSNCIEPVLGYWTKDLEKSNSTNAWVVSNWGGNDAKNINNSNTRGIRPVITVLKSNLAG